MTSQWINLLCCADGYHLAEGPARCFLDQREQHRSLLAGDAMKRDRRAYVETNDRPVGPRFTVHRPVPAGAAGVMCVGPSE